MFLYILFISLLFPGLLHGNRQPLFACDHEIFCKGELLHRVQMAKIFDDAKTFVDMRMKADPGMILQHFQKLQANTTKDELRKFVMDNFQETGSDLEEVLPVDWVENPKSLQSIKDARLKSWALSLNKIWKSLSRQITKQARRTIDRSSLIVVEQPFVVPGGRFREYYYWDSYWIINGILVCGMKETAKGMLENYLGLVQKYGLVPNGGRIYYLNRSQPPFLIQMLHLYYEYTSDLEFIRSNIAILEKEYSFWVTKRREDFTISGVKYTLAIYKANMTTPRPESYWHDYETGYKLNAGDQTRFYQAVASAAESGWDFSSRWFNQSGADKDEFKSMRTPDVIPVDLNCILYKNELSMAKFYDLIGNQSQAAYYQEAANRRLAAINAVLWDDQLGLWVDYDVVTRERTRAFYASSVVALWAGISHGNKSREERVFHAMKDLKLLNYPGGLPTSLKKSGEQWDFPNAWPPLQHMFIVGLSQSKSTMLQNEAKKIAQNWVQSNWKGYLKDGHMFEKYVVTSEGNSGYGGEYKPQLGFGWTNGVILDLLLRYPDELHVENRASIVLCAHTLLYPILFVLYTFHTVMQ